MTFPKNRIITNLSMLNQTTTKQHVHKHMLHYLKLRGHSSASMMLTNCAKPWCKKKVPSNGKHKACQSCQEHDRLNQKARHVTIKSKQVQNNGSKRKRTESISSLEERPSTQHRSDRTEERNNEGSESDSSDNDSYTSRPHIVSY